ncbi:N-fatty-acyl-amino acid synthase/hydrolase PM20D1 [Galendromus occidentalis]|uniref:N-fatty-acyl-amino acid synthase/hydrolase PM20D1 n=1 Tax=Galendromus occidentalis TaxID=34638 RepID=A0AAJ6W0G3_9ACAR|nr:N-fatty-acyl-amino acid synthase/hydrolase PM20D1 [Galendromus occidentalis]
MPSVNEPAAFGLLDGEAREDEMYSNTQRKPHINSKRIMMKILLGVLLAFVGLVMVLAIRTMTLKANVEDLQGEGLKTNFEVSIAEGLSDVIRFATISYDRYSPWRINHTAFRGLNEYLFKRFPLVFTDPPSWITHKTIANYSILIHVRGRNAELKPYMLCAHLDVVPVDEKLWTHPPFEGFTDETHVWGRGTLDNKHNLMAILEALALRVERKQVPKRSFYIAFGHDEEISGFNGAKAIAENLASTGVKLEFILDEGLVILKKGVPGLENPMALIGVAEKGYLTVKVKCTDAAKHSSIPSQETAITILAKALTRFTGNAHPAHLTELQESLLREAAPYARFPFNVVYLNLWLFRPLLWLHMSRVNTLASQMRTTSAVTVIEGGSKENVIPNEAEALVNHRILPGYSIREVLEFDQNLVKDIPNVSVEIFRDSGTEPTLASPHDENSFGFSQIKKTTRQIHPTALVAPSLMVANTDTKHYFAANLTESIYRYSAVPMTFADTAMVHGNNEKISKLDFQRLADFYYQLIKNCDEDHTDGATTRRAEL